MNETEVREANIQLAMLCDQLKHSVEEYPENTTNAVDLVNQIKVQSDRITAALAEE